MPKPDDPTPLPLIEGRIFLIRGQKVLLDRDLATAAGSRSMRAALGSEGRELIDLEKRERLIRLVVGSVSSEHSKRGYRTGLETVSRLAPNPGSTRTDLCCIVSIQIGLR
jgi:hypothetical protein